MTDPFPIGPQFNNERATIAVHCGDGQVFLSCPMVRGFAQGRAPIPCYDPDAKEFVLVEDEKVRITLTDAKLEKAILDEINTWMNAWTAKNPDRAVILRGDGKTGRDVIMTLKQLGKEYDNQKKALGKWAGSGGGNLPPSGTRNPGGSSGQGGTPGTGSENVAIPDEGKQGALLH